MASANLTIVVWNVEHGSSIYAKTPNGRTILMDAGKSDSFSPAHWLNSSYSIEHVDLFTLSHADCDHIDDIENVDKLVSPRTFHRNKEVPRSLVYPTDPPPTNPLKYYSDFDARYCHTIPPDSPYQWQPPTNWGGVTIKAFASEYPSASFTNLNDYSIALFLTYGNLEFLFPGDLEAPGWAALMEDSNFMKYSTPSSTNKDEIRILMAAHHGRSAGVYKPFLELYRPHLVIMSDVYGNETTDAASYYPYTQGYPVYSKSQDKSEVRKIVSTKTNDYVLMVSSDSRVGVEIA